MKDKPSKRVYEALEKHPNIERIWYVDADGSRSEPRRGGRYRARTSLNGTRHTRAFETLSEAREWLSNGGVALGLRVVQEERLAGAVQAGAVNPTLAELIAEYRQKHYPLIKPSTRGRYDRVFGSCFTQIEGMRVRDITPAVVDDWLVWIAAHRSHSGRRVMTRHELVQLGGLFSFFREYFDSGFQSPILKRHKRQTKVCINPKARAREKVLTETEFWLFREQLLSGKLGAVLAALASVQYWQGLRIGEAAGIKWGNVFLDGDNPENSFLRLDQHVVYARSKQETTRIEQGLKNAQEKHLPLFKPAFDVLLELTQSQHADPNALVFRNPCGGLLPYRAIQHAYDRAFLKAGLEHRGTHCLRHSRATALFDESGGNISLVGELLGDQSLSVVQKYAKRLPRALRNLAQKSHRA